MFGALAEFECSVIRERMRLFNTTLLGVIPHQGVEVSFVSPVEYRYMPYQGHI
jgi:hypothetical protein